MCPDKIGGLDQGPCGLSKDVDLHQGPCGLSKDVDLHCLNQLVGGFKHLLFSTKNGIILPIDKLIFFKIVKTC